MSSRGKSINIEFFEVLKRNGNHSALVVFNIFVHYSAIHRNQIKLFLITLNSKRTAAATSQIPMIVVLFSDVRCNLIFLPCFISVL